MLINIYPMSQSSICNVMFSVDIVVCWQLKCISLMTPEHFKLNFWTTVYNSVYNSKDLLLEIQRKTQPIWSHPGTVK